MYEDVYIREGGRNRCGVSKNGWKCCDVVFVQHRKRALGGDTFCYKNARGFTEDKECLILPESGEVEESKRSLG